jgi:hypothetical protein
MPYTTPTVAQFIERFPNLSESDESLIQVLLDEAARTIDKSYEEHDYQPAILYLAAHLMATDNSAEGEDVELGGTTGGIASESFGGMSISYANGGSAAGSLAASASYGSTVFGRRFLEIVRRNRGGPLVA